MQRCILSVLNQEYMNYEILLIDDGSEESRFEAGNKRHCST
ncbi:MAG: glycosyltransferase [Blautia wexlerae]